jgi:hypothetical protein
MKKTDLIEAAILQLQVQLDCVEIQEEEQELELQVRMKRLTDYLKKNRRPRALQCDMSHDCKGAVTHLEEKGWIYCSTHAGIRKFSGRRCRKLRPHELKKLQSGQPLKRY